MCRLKKAIVWKLVIQASKSLYGFLFPGHPRMQKGTCLLLFPASTRARKKHKKGPSLFARLTIKPDTMSSRIGKKEGWLHEPLTLHRIPMPVYSEREMLLPFFTISRQGTKTVPHSITAQYKRHKQTENNLRMTLSNDCTTRRPTSCAT
jgi:hypothetical protein